MAWDPLWEGIFSTRPWGKYPPEELIRFVARNHYQAPDRKAVRFLEVGFGMAANLWYLAREGFSVYGVEGAATGVEVSRKRLDAEVPGWHGELVVGDIMKLPFEAESFDVVLDVAAICCNSWEDSQQIYREMHRVCKPGGRLFSKTFASGYWGDGTGAAAGRDCWYPAEGPLIGVGMVRFTPKEDVPALIHPFRLDDLDLVTRTMNGGLKETKVWVITGTRV
jgi:SAM-dependent methyltransferase